MRIERRVDDLDWDAVFAGLDDIGIAPLGQILDDDECRELGALYEDGSLFRSTIDMARHRFGQGPEANVVPREYRRRSPFQNRCLGLDQTETKLRTAPSDTDG